MNYQEVSRWLANRPKLAFDKGVERVKWLLQELGNPQLQVPAVHVVGTNGKGSTIAFLESMCREAGYRVGRFTSPSIIDDREQVVVDGQMISEEDFAGLVSDLEPLAQRLARETDLGEASDFELLVVTAFLYFAQVARPDMVLVEAGMGGLMDATNVLEPLAVVCPSIGLDHQAFLGETYVAIAEQKAGVLRRGVPFIYASQREDVGLVFEQRARDLQCLTYALGRDVQVVGNRQQFQVRTPMGELSYLTSSLEGQHQLDNAAVAVMAAQLLSERFRQIDGHAIRSGLARASWPGRLEWLAKDVLIDGAHNAEGVEALCRFLETEHKGKEIRILFAAIHAKPAPQMLERLARVGQVTVTTFADPRAIGLSDYPQDYQQVADFRDWEMKRGEHRLYVITGSLYFIKQVRAYVTKEKGIR